MKKPFAGFQKVEVDEWDYEQRKVDAWNAVEGHLHEEDGIDCRVCKNKGFIEFLEGSKETDKIPTIRSKKCGCMTKREITANAKESGMGDAIYRKFVEFKAAEPWQKALKDCAMDFVADPSGWLVILGQVGSGKTFIASCAASQMLRSGKRLLCKSWTELVRESGVDWYKEKDLLREYQTCEVLFLDDFLKTEPKPRDLDVAFELLDYRYRNRLLTIITSERTPDEIMAYDQALLSRIRQMSGSHLFVIGRDQGKDQRAKRGD